MLNKACALIIGLFLISGCARKASVAPKESQKPPLLQSEEKTGREIVTLAEKNDERIRNPFLSEDSENKEILFTNSRENTTLIHSLNLSAVFYSPEHTNRAIINGEILKKGDSLGNKKIVDIQPEAVILEDGVSQYTVKLNG